MEEQRHKMTVCELEGLKIKKCEVRPEGWKWQRKDKEMFLGKTESCISKQQG